MDGKCKAGLSKMRALAMACAAVPISLVLAPPPVHADSTIYEYQFTGETFNPTTVAGNLTGSPFSYVNANPSEPPFTNPPFIVQGGIDPDDPPFYVGQGDWFPAGNGLNEDYYTFAVSVAPGFVLNASSFSLYANSRQAVLFDSQVAYSNSSSFSNPVNFDTTPFLIPATNVWNTFTASDAPISNGTATYYFRIYNQVDPNGSGTISDLLNMGNISLIGSIQTDSAATNMYWDPSKLGSPGSGGAGTWTGTTAWADGAVDYPWSNTIAEIANFGGPTTGTVALGGNVSALNGINFTTGGYNITGAAGQVLSVAGTINASADATISASLTASGALTKAGAGTLTVMGTPNLGTSLSITGGTLKLVGGTVSGSTCSIASNSVLEYNDSGFTDQTPITYTGTGTLRETGSGNLIFGALGAIDIDFSPGALIDVEGGLLTGSSSYGGDWLSNYASLNIAGGATFNAVEAGLAATMQIDALTGAGTFLGGYFGNGGGGLSTVTIGVAGGSGTFSGALQDNSDARLGIVKTGAGTETLSGTNTNTGGTTVNQGTLVIAAKASLPDAPVIVQGTGTLQLGNSIGGVTVPSLLISSFGQLNLANNHILIDYGSGSDPIALIGDYILSGYNGGAWNGPGIISTAAKANPGYGIGYADSADKGNPASLPSGTIDIQYTLLGDADLNGVVNGVDFGILAANFNKGVTGWDKGDFNYDNIVNGVDFADLAANFNKGASGTSFGGPALDDPAILAFAAANGLMADVPEPTSAGVMLVLAAAALVRPGSSRIRRSASRNRN